MKLMTGNNCSPCKMVKTWLKDQNLDVEILIAEDNMELAKELGVRSLPTLILDDNTLIKGVDDIIKYLQGDK